MLNVRFEYVRSGRHQRDGDDALCAAVVADEFVGAGAVAVAETAVEEGGGGGSTSTAGGIVGGVLPQVEVCVDRKVADFRGGEEPHEAADLNLVVEASEVGGEGD